MNRAVLVCTLCAVLSSSWLENVDAQLSSENDSGSIIQSIGTLSKVVEGLQTEIKMQSSVLSNLVSKEELESILLNNLATKSDMQMQKIAFQNLEAKAAKHENLLSNLQVSVDELKTLLINSNVKDDDQLTSFSNLEAQSTMQTILHNNNVGANLENQTSLVSNFLTKEEMRVSNVKNMDTQEPPVFDGAETVAKGMENSTASKGIVGGIIAGTEKGAFIIPLDSREQRAISNKDTFGVAFNWQSRKVYWIERNVGIKIADLDGTDEEVLISDPDLSGLAVDQITGNVYYGVRGYNTSVRVCDTMGQKCATIVSSDKDRDSSIFGIALYSSQGIMFWSSANAIVFRASMDGTNATVIISERIAGLYLDEFTEKLYWVNFETNNIGHGDLNGYNRSVLLNTTINTLDIEVDGDTVYFGGYDPNGVYSVTSNGQVSSIANTTEGVFHIALFGRNKVSSRPNPCKDSPCTNLCVLNRVSYTCL